MEIEHWWACKEARYALMVQFDEPVGIGAFDFHTEEELRELYPDLEFASFEDLVRITDHVALCIMEIFGIHLSLIWSTFNILEINFRSELREDIDVDVLVRKLGSML